MNPRESMMEPRVRDGMNLDVIGFIVSGGNTLRLSPGVGGWVGRFVRRRPKSKIAFFRVLKHPLRSHTTKPFTEQRTPLPLRTYQGKRHRGRVSPRAGCLSILHKQFTYMQLYKHSQSPMAPHPIAWPGVAAAGLSYCAKACVMVLTSTALTPVVLTLAPRQISFSCGMVSFASCRTHRQTHTDRQPRHSDNAPHKGGSTSTSTRTRTRRGKLPCRPGRTAALPRERTPRPPRRPWPRPRGRGRSPRRRPHPLRLRLPLP